MFAGSAERFVGFNWSFKLAKNPLSPQEAAKAIVKAAGVRPMKIFDYDRVSISALQNAGVTHLSVAVPNADLPALNNSPSFAVGVCEV